MVDHDVSLKHKTKKQKKAAEYVSIVALSGSESARQRFLGLLEG